MLSLFQPRPLTRGRVALALSIAAIMDAIQIGMGPLGWAFFDQAADVAAMIATSLLLGFHPLLLPTFVIELFPGVDMIPTWTGCVGAVLLLRRRSSQPPVVDPPPEAQPPVRKAAEPTGPIIDV
jgi:hypothetical protein